MPPPPRIAVLPLLKGSHANPNRGAALTGESENSPLGTPFFPPLSIFGIESIQGYGVMVPRAQAEAIRGAGEVAGQRLILLKDPESPVLDRLGIE